MTKIVNLDTLLLTPLFLTVGYNIFLFFKVERSILYHELKFVRLEILSSLKKKHQKIVSRKKKWTKSTNNNHYQFNIIYHSHFHSARNQTKTTCSHNTCCSASASVNFNSKSQNKLFVTLSSSTSGSKNNLHVNFINNKIKYQRELFYDILFVSLNTNRFTTWVIKKSSPH